MNYRKFPSVIPTNWLKLLRDLRRDLFSLDLSQI